MRNSATLNICMPSAGLDAKQNRTPHRIPSEEELRKPVNCTPTAGKRTQHDGPNRIRRRHRIRPHHSRRDHQAMPHHIPIYRRWNLWLCYAMGWHAPRENSHPHELLPSVWIQSVRPKCSIDIQGWSIITLQSGGTILHRGLVLSVLRNGNGIPGS